jgi:hypothetical protein
MWQDLVVSWHDAVPGGAVCQMIRTSPVSWDMHPSDHHVLPVAVAAAFPQPPAHLTCAACPAPQAYKRQGWTETFVQWTPQGNYLITMHRQGVALWGGPEYKRAARIAHPNVSLIDISPNERYMITYSSYEAPDPREPPRCLMNIFDTRTTKLVRKFEAPIDDFAIGAAAGAQDTLIWPVFKWAGGKQVRSNRGNECGAGRQERQLAAAC